MIMKMLANAVAERGLTFLAIKKMLVINAVFSVLRV